MIWFFYCKSSLCCCVRICSRRSKSITRTGNGDGKKSPDLGHVLDTEIIGFADGLNLGDGECEGKNRIKYNTEIFIFSNWVDGGVS